MGDKLTQPEQFDTLVAVLADIILIGCIIIVVGTRGDMLLLITWPRTVTQVGVVLIQLVHGDT